MWNVCKVSVFIELGIPALVYEGWHTFMWSLTTLKGGVLILAGNVCAQGRRRQENNSAVCI